MIIVIVKKELLGAMFAIVVTDHQVHWLATALFERIESSIRHLNKCLVTKINNPKIYRLPDIPFEKDPNTK